MPIIAFNPAAGRLQTKVDQRVIPLGRPTNQYLDAIADWNLLLSWLGLTKVNIGIARFTGAEDSLLVDFTVAPFVPFVLGEEQYRLLVLAVDATANGGVIPVVGLTTKDLASMTIGTLSRGNFDVHFAVGI